MLGGTAVALWLWRAIEQTVPGAIAASWQVLLQDLMLAVGVGSVIAAIGTGIAVLVRRRLPIAFLGVFVFSVLLLLTMGAGPSLVGWSVVCLVVVIAAVLFGAWLGGLVGARIGLGRRPGWCRTAAALVAVLIAGLGGGWLAWPGPGAPDLVAAREGRVPLDPTVPGAHPVRVTTYGSASTGISSRYGADVDVITEPVDASEVIEGWDADDPRSEVWGFDASALPVNGTVWAPSDGGPYPLVLVVHGNTPRTDSELGFDYLGELLASRGYIVASIDQSFLNTSVLDRSGGITGADRARAWLMLEHLDQWVSWTRSAQSPIGVTPDVGRVALVGHSRGGEAAAVAAAMRQADSRTDPSGSEPHVDITSVIALAPSDGMVLVDGEPVTLDGVNYLTVAGSHDADVGAFAGTNQYARTSIQEGQVKAAILIYRANHSQFNTRWGRFDAGLGLSKHMLDTAALLEPEEQQQATSVFVSAFLDLTVLENDDARPIFGSPLPDAAWLPRTDYRIAVAAGDQSRITGFTDAGSTDGRDRPEPSADEGTARITTLPLRAGSSSNSVLHLRPDRPDASVSVTVAVEGLSGVGPADRVVVDLADARAPGASGDTTTVEVVITDSVGRTATCPVTGPAGLDGPMPARTVKSALFQSTPISEPSLRTYSVSRDCVADRTVDLDAVETLTFRAEGVSGDGLYLDNIGVVP